MAIYCILFRKLNTPMLCDCVFLLFLFWIFFVTIVVISSQLFSSLGTAHQNTANFVINMRDVMWQYKVAYKRNRAV